MTSNRERFNGLLKKWELNRDNLEQLQEKQSQIVQEVNECFAQIITEEQLLSGMDWLIEIWPAGAALSCLITDEKTKEFLDLFRWERIGWHSAIKMGEHYVHINDNDMSISLESVDDMIEFCKEQGIKPNMTKLNDQRSTAQKKADYYSRIIERLSD